MHRYHLVKASKIAFSSNNADVCVSCLQFNSAVDGKRAIYLSSARNVQYTSALKYLLTKRKKKSKKDKKVVSLYDRQEHVSERSTIAIDMLKARKIISASSLLGARQESNQNNILPTHVLQSCAAIRHYDPLITLPINDPNSFVDDLLQADLPQKQQSRLSNKVLPPKASDLISSITSSISIPSIISEVQNAATNGQHVVSVNIGEINGFRSRVIPKIRDLSKIQAVRDVSRPERKELRRKLKLRPVDELKEEVLANHEPSLNTQKLPTIESEDNIDIASTSLNPKVEKQRLKKKSFNVSLKKKTRELLAKKKMTDLERKGKEESLNANFLSFADVCAHTGMAVDAYNALKAYRRKISLQAGWNPKILDMQVYNAIISGLAKEGQLARITELISMAEEDGLKANATTYAGIIECLIRKRQKSQTSIATFLEDLKNENISIHDVLNSPYLSVEMYERVVDAVKTVEPDFRHISPSSDVSYSCYLLQPLNDEKSFYASPTPAHLDSNDLKNFYEEQLSVEKSNYTRVRTIEKRTEPAETVQHYRDKLLKAQEEWKGTIEKAFDRDLELLKAQGRFKSYFFFTIYPYIMSISKADHVEIILHEIRKLAEGSETYSPTIKHLYRELGTQVCLRYHIRKKEMSGTLEQLNLLFGSYCDWYVNPDDSALNTRQKWQELLHNNAAAARLCGADTLWRSHVLAGVGRFLYNIIIRDIKINVNCMRLTSNSKEHMLPAFYTLFRNKGHTSKEEVKPHPTLSRLFRAAAPEDLVFEASKIPMVCPPQPWTSITSGGYLVTKTELIRLPFQAVAQWKALEKTPVNNLYPAFDSLNQLGAVPWAVNESVLDVMLEVFNSGGSAKLDVPEPPSACLPADPATPDMSPHERFLAYRQRLAVRRKKAEMYSLWCDALYKLSLANHFRKRIFWLPHNMDFRGRVYPVAPHLNHLGSDLSRALLVFAKRRPLGPDGFDWLKIHAINLTGTHKKQSVAERLKYANEIIDDILDSAENPLTGKMWWAQSEEPWQTLAACCEIRNALASGDPATYVSGFPVHQDGSCNGLQHYAALGRDQAGGESVNLTPALVPQDVYSCVAAIVERERANDAINGVTIAQVLEGFIYRKVIKQTVMTTVYGVTRFGARLQIARQLKDLDEFPKQYVWPASMYLVTKTFESLQEMFTSTKEIQDWFTECARLIAQVCGENVEWITPLGLPIVQPYTRGQTSTADNIKFIGVNASTMADAFERPNVMKQKNAFAPNFIHSLDSSHMMLTSLFCERAGVTFVSVHDCYWTHACSVPDMNKICRDQFVALHSQPILKDLSEYFVNRFAYPETTFHNDGSIADQAKRNLNRALLSQPKTGSLDLNSVLKSPYFFS